MNRLYSWKSDSDRCSALAKRLRSLLPGAGQPKNQLSNQSGMYPLHPLNGHGSTSWTHSSRIPLGSTFYLLELRNGNSPPTYILESEGHPEGFSLDGYVSQFKAKAQDWPFEDCIPIFALF